MNSVCQQAETSLDDSLCVLLQGLERLRAAQPVDVKEVTEQLYVAAEAAHNLRLLVASALPHATWQSREELDALVGQSEKVLEARSRLLSLVAELERGTVSHRRTLRVNHLNRLRERAIEELRSKAGLESVPAVLPGPETAQWIDWACALKDPDDEMALQTLRDGFPCLDNFVANLESNMWLIKVETAA